MSREGVLGGNWQKGSCPRGVIVLWGRCPRASYPKYMYSCPSGNCLRDSCPRTAPHIQKPIIHVGPVSQIRRKVDSISISNRPL